MTARPLSLAIATLVMSLPGAARAEGETDSRSRDRVVFYAAMAATGVGVAAWVFAGMRVADAEEDLDRLGPMVAMEQGYPGDRFEDLCADADGDDGSASSEALSVCRRGKRWSVIGNVSAGLAIGSAVVAGVFAVRMIRSTDGEQKPAAARRAAWRVQPSAGPSSVGLGLDLEF